MRVILHADLDCFYCQVEQIRLNIPSSVPLAVQQWDKVIAVNYPARAAGVSRHSSYKLCQQACPTINLVHVPTYSITDTKLRQYEACSGENMVTIPDRNKHKASLDPYRRVSMEIFKIFKKVTDIVEKASVDEAFLDVTSQAKEMLMELTRSTDINIVWENLDWSLAGKAAINSIPLDPKNNANLEKSNEVMIWIGAKIAAELRKTIFNELGYTCSIGIAQNKLLAKLASARNKPNQQTFVLESHVTELMHQTPLQKIRFLGGKMGKLLVRAERNREVEESFDDNDNDNDNASDDNKSDKEENNQTIDNNFKLMASDLWPMSLCELEDRSGLDQSAAKWVYNVIRGIDDSIVNARTHAKSFHSTKNMRPPIKDWDLLKSWLFVLCSEVKYRIEEDYQLNLRWPQTLNISFRSQRVGFHTKSAKFAFDRNFKLELLIELAERILKQQQDLLPCSLLVVGVTRFAKCGHEKANNTLDKFLTVTNDENRLFSLPFVRSHHHHHSHPQHPHNSKNNSNQSTNKAAIVKSTFFKSKQKNKDPNFWECIECGKLISVALLEDIQEHQDYHFALKIQSSQF